MSSQENGFRLCEWTNLKVTCLYRPRLDSVQCYLRKSLLTDWLMSLSQITVFYLFVCLPHYIAASSRHLHKHFSFTSGFSLFFWTWTCTSSQWSHDCCFDVHAYFCIPLKSQITFSSFVFPSVIKRCINCRIISSQPLLDTPPQQGVVLWPPEAIWK